MMVGLKRISTVVGLLAVTASAAFGQGTVANPNQTTADSVASTLRASRTLAGSRIEIEAQDGLVTLTGALASPALKAEAVARVQHVAGVRGVVDRLQVRDRTVMPAQYQPQVALGHHRGGYGGRTMVSDMTPGGPIGAPVARRLACERRRPDSGRTSRQRGRRAMPGAPELCLAQLCALSQLLGGRLSHGLSLAGLAEHRPLLPLPGSPPRLARRDPALGRRHLVA